MENNEKIQAFFSNSENLEALASHEEFIEKIAGGQATPELYERELGAMGLHLTPEEAKAVQTATERAMGVSPEELDNIMLENVSAGGGLSKTLGVTGALASCASVGCSIAGTVYRFKAYSALKRGDLETGKRYTGLSLKLWGSSMGLGAGAVASLGGAVLTSDPFKRGFEGARRAGSPTAQQDS